MLADQYVKWWNGLVGKLHRRYSKSAKDVLGSVEAINSLSECPTLSECVTHALRLRKLGNREVSEDLSRIQERALYWIRVIRRFRRVHGESRKAVLNRFLDRKIGIFEAINSIIGGAE